MPLPIALSVANAVSSRRASANMNPTLSGFILFIRNIMGVTTAQLPDNSPSIPYCFNYAMIMVNKLLQIVCNPDPSQPDLYAIAVYNFAADRLCNWAMDPVGAPIYMNGLPFFAYVRKTWNLVGFTSGVIQSTNDLTTGGSYVVPEQLSNLTLADLQMTKTPYGIEYLGIAQSYGTDWGIS